MKKLRIIVGGYVGLYPTGGATWDYLQYPLGLMMLGHDVYYFEDTAQYPVYQIEDSKWNNSTATIAYIKDSMESVGLGERWAYRDVGTEQWHGLSNQKIKEIFNTADIFINVSSATYIWPEYLKIPVRIMIDTDPMFTQVEFWEMMKQGSSERLENFMSHTHFFTFGLNMGAEDCRIPDLGLKWETTKKPICMGQWANKNIQAHNNSFTSILNWIERKPFQFDNDSWGQKNIIFKKFQDLPGSYKGKEFEMVVNTGNKKETLEEMELLRNKGWKINSPHNTIADMWSYNSFIKNSFGEFSITKATYIKSNSGWFSGRSACYLAAGRPVITQDTMWSKYFPEGEGLFACNDLESAQDAISEIEANYPLHSSRAVDIAREYFDSGVVMEDLFSKVESNVVTT